MPPPNIDRVQAVKWESSAKGGTEEDIQPVGMNETEDALSGRGFYFQPATGSADESVLVWRDGDNLKLQDATCGPYTLSDLVSIATENIPILEYSSASTVNVKSKPGASSTLKAILQGGLIYTITSPLTINLAVSGRGGIDTGSEASDKWYYCYLVPAVAAGELGAICSVTAPPTGPTGWPLWKYIGAIRNNSSSNLKTVHQRGNEFFYVIVSEGIVYDGGGAGYIEPEASLTELSLTSYVPATASSMQWSSYLDLKQENCYWQIFWSINGTSTYQGLYLSGAVNSGNAKGIIIFYAPLGSTKNIWRKRYRSSGALDLNWIIYGVKSWVDEYL